MLAQGKICPFKTNRYFLRLRKSVMIFKISDNICFAHNQDVSAFSVLQKNKLNLDNFFSLYLIKYSLIENIV